MLSIITVAASALALVGLSYGSDVPNKLSDITWSLPINPADDSSATVSFTGTIEQAVAKMEADYPGWNATFLAQDPISNTIGDTKSGNPVRHDCNVPGEEAAIAFNIEAGISYLRRVSGTAKNGPGPLNCGRVSCSYNSGIVWCNNDNVEKEVQWSQIADGAQYVLDNCGTSQLVKGQVDYDDNWSVSVHKDWC
ncbi:hypothetical protein QBC40DRAFT_309232 [Triangularia verruculosa]|uniref:Uncharacterized protein n=1 Tax=Triangularia verruculosa TaxID=2587418 RepID=A0AAN6XAQ3_9PEZI|nr:hypothetical protein QBC40DRAFT_309232 [Triangularia verruculosa]